MQEVSKKVQLIDTTMAPGGCFEMHMEVTKSQHNCSKLFRFFGDFDIAS